jgi:hypothetical protein
MTLGPTANVQLGQAVEAMFVRLKYQNKSGMKFSPLFQPVRDNPHAAVLARPVHRTPNVKYLSISVLRMTAPRGWVTRMSFTRTMRPNHDSLP